ncbi:MULTISPECIES: tetratricopeptide repeat protein [Streptomyces]|uniref:Tetratricopeptide repeat protein 38 n=1 Tax=Streptomyces solicathayae TaxID=3081768 RepID=A0ABZ0LLY5_9ACTN|nr:tetratricopeptide repeat protein [Streptomyces sp. HUAS YS2]WOX20508.1 tetratricopeptide repeat protein [Streptomyces sp. HUAS YS2]
MTTDRYGHAVHNGTSEAAAHLDRAVESLLFFRPEVADAVEDLLKVAPASPLAQAFAVYLGVLGTEPGDAAAARRRFDAFAADVDPTGLPMRELLHMAAAEALLAGDLRRGSALLEEVVVAHPRDALALFVGHQLDFLTGDALRLRDRIGGVLSAWEADDPHRGPLLGMYAFGLEESGHYVHARETGSAAIEQNPHDVWAIHAVVHTYEMQGRFTEGIAFLDARTEHWSSGNFLTVHNWWHYALYALEAGATDTALGIYDAALHNEESRGLAMELLDAAAMLWRFHLAGIDQSARWEALADAWSGRADPPHYVFNDVHAVMSYVGAGRVAEAERLIADRRRWLVEAGTTAVTNHAMTAHVGLPVCEALVAYGRGDHAAVVELLWPVRRRLHEFGGSHAQRDAVQKTLLESSLKSGRHDMARTLISERTALRPDSPYNWLSRARLADSLGDAAQAAVARDRASTLGRTGDLTSVRV